MALPAIEEDAKMQNDLCHVMGSPVFSGGLPPNRAPLLSMPSTCSIIPAPKKPIKPQFVSRAPKPFNPNILWRFVPTRRRFYSSDNSLRSSATLYPYCDHGESSGQSSTIGLNEVCCSDIGEEKYEPKPWAESDQVAGRRRTCSENFTKSSRGSSSFWLKFNSFDDVDLEILDHRERWKGKPMAGEEGRTTDEDGADQGFVEVYEECKETEIVKEAAEVQPIDHFVDGSWSLQCSGIQQREAYSGAGIRPVSGSTRSVESDGQNLEKLRNLQKLYQEGFITVTEYKDRRVQLVDELAEADQTIAKTTDLLSLEVPIVYREPPDFSLLRERDAIKHVFNSEHRAWTSLRIKVKIDGEPFANGGFRQVFHLQDLSTPPPALRMGGVYEDSVMSKCTSYVAKVAINPNENPDTYFKDVEMQAVAAKYATSYNSYNPPRRVEFLEACILQLIPTGASEAGDQVIESLTLRGTICGVEPFIAGEYHKHNNNFGYVSELERNTPQAFSHFTYEASGQQIIVVDIQGVGDHYTDPQIHSRRGKEFGKGNLALRGFKRFLDSHRCNPICRYLKLPLINPKDEEDRQVGLKGTIPAQTYMSQPRVAVDQVDSVLCHYYGDSKAFKRYAAKKKREKRKRGKHQKSHSRPGHEEKWKAQEFGIEAAGDFGDDRNIEHAVGPPQAGNRFARASQHRSCSSFVCDGVSQCVVS